MLTSLSVAYVTGHLTVTKYKIFCY